MDQTASDTDSKRLSTRETVLWFTVTRPLRIMRLENGYVAVIDDNEVV